MKELVRACLAKGNSVPTRPVRTGSPKRSFHLFFADDELSAVDAQAESFGSTRTNYLMHVIHAALQGLNQVSPGTVLEVREANRQLAAIGRNLNQIAKLSHVTGENLATRQILLDLAGAIKAQQDQLAALMEKVVRHA